MIDLSTSLCILGGGLAAAAGPVLGSRAAPRSSKLATVVAAAHPFVSLVLFYSLALHMHLRLGEWPRTLGHDTFPRGLAVHADVATATFSAMAIGGLFAWPILVLLFATVPALRPAKRYVAVYGLAWCLSFGATFLAPEAFLYWWWD